MDLKFKKLHPDAVLPTYAKPGDAGMDITAIDGGTYVRETKATAYLEYRTGLAVEIPEGHVGLIFPRSSISKKDLILANSVGVIDSGFRGEIKFRFKTFRTYDYAKGDRIGQLIVVPFPTMSPQWADELSDSERGSGGFGSSGS